MTKELKTLKDLNWNCNDKDDLVEDLKAEAVKWVKAIDKNWNNGNMSLDERDFTRDFIKHFFNLTEEDLKDD